MPETRKQRKQQRKKSGKKNKRLSNKQIEKLAWAIVIADPPLKIKHANAFSHCPSCGFAFCVRYDGFSFFCSDCAFSNGSCLKLQDQPIIHKCDFCGDRSVE